MTQLTFSSLLTLLSEFGSDFDEKLGIYRCNSRERETCIAEVGRVGADLAGLADAALLLVLVLALHLRFGRVLGRLRVADAAVVFGRQVFLSEVKENLGKTKEN